MMRFACVSLLWKILLSTSVAITLLFAVTGWIVLNDAVTTTSASVEHEVNASFRAYESLWNSRSAMLASVSSILSTMSDVRAAFGTGDEATIRDTAGELWSRISDQSAIFLVADPRGRVIASLGGHSRTAFPAEVHAVAQAAARFPNQVSGFVARSGRLFHLTITPVYVHTTGGVALLDVLVAGYDVDGGLAERLKQATGGSEFLFTSGERVLASTLPWPGAARVAHALEAQATPRRVSDGVSEYAPLITPLTDLAGKPIAKLAVLRSFEAAGSRLADLRRNIILLWVLSMAAGLAITYTLARRIVEPVKALDRAAAEVARQNYDCRVEVSSDDELGRLAETFNAMCASIRRAREELIRQERISTVGQLATSIVHDLRNPLAAIYGGAEVLADTDLPPSQTKRLARNMYHASRRIQELLTDLLNVRRGRVEGFETCGLRSVAESAAGALAAAAEAQDVKIVVEIPEELELPLERRRMERVFANLIENALDVMPDGGLVRVLAETVDGAAVVEVSDTGPGIAPEVLAKLFQPFATAGKKTGLGLGLALSRQTVLDHGGEMWADTGPRQGACIRFRLPLNRNDANVVAA